MTPDYKSCCPVESSKASTTIALGKVGAIEYRQLSHELGSFAIVYYDGGCVLCRNLAHFAARFIDNQRVRFVEAPLIENAPSALPDKLLLKVEVFEAESGHPSVLPSAVLLDSEAWQWLMNNHPALQPLNWIAVHLGLKKETPLLIKRTADFLRGFCKACR
jgi:hypothetical protein